MKKLFIILLFTFVLAACGTENTTDNQVSDPAGNTTDDRTQGSSIEEEETTITLYQSDEQAENTIPFEVKFNEDEMDLVPFIFSKVNGYDVELLDYTFENNDQSLILNLGDDVYTIQGSAGASMFVESLARSYFGNLPNVGDITFIHKGSYEPILDHMNIGEPYSRQDFDM